MVIRLIEALEKNGLESEGLFRIAGTRSDVNALKNEFENGMMGTAMVKSIPSGSYHCRV